MEPDSLNAYKMMLFVRAFMNETKTKQISLATKIEE